MRISFILILLLKSFMVLAQAPSFEWIKEGKASVSHIAVDSSGYIYLTAMYSGIINIADTTLISTGYPLDTIPDILVAKYNNLGNIVWIKTIKGNFFDRPKSITIDENNNIYVIGNSISSKLYIASDTIESSFYSSIFIAKFDKYGNYKWTKIYGSNSIDFSCNSSCYSNTGCLYLTGSFFHDLIIDNDTLMAVNNGTEIFVIKTDTSGNSIWAITEGGNAYDEGMDIIADVDGNFFVTGYYSTVAVTYKFDSNGNKIWSKDGSGYQYAKSNGISIDNSGNVYITGTFTSYVYFDNFYLNDFSSLGMFMVKYSSNGDVIWAKKAIGASQGFNYGNKIFADHQGGLYLNGYFKGPYIIFEDDTLFNTNANFFDIFLIKYDTAGQKKWVKSFGSLDDDWGYDVKKDDFGNVYSTGSLSYPANIEGNLLSGDYYLAKIHEMNSDINVNQQNGTYIYPNPANDFLILNTPTNFNHGICTIFNFMGEEVLKFTLTETQTTVNIKSLKVGMYLLKIEGNKEVRYVKFLKE